MRVDWCVSSWFRIKNTHSLTHAGRRGVGVGCGVSVRVCLRLRHGTPLAFFLLTTKASAKEFSRDGSRGGYPLAALGNEDW